MQEDLKHYRKPPCGARGDPMNLRFFNNFVHSEPFFHSSASEMAKRLSDKLSTLKSQPKIDGLEDGFPFGMAKFSGPNG